MSSDHINRLKKLFFMCNSEDDIQKISDDAMRIRNEVNRLTNRQYQLNIKNHAGNIDKNKVIISIENKLGKHTCDPYQHEGIGYNGRWCSGCGCLFLVKWKSNSSSVYGYEDKFILVWRPIGKNPKTCNCSYRVGYKYFNHAVLTRTEVKYCLECGSIHYPKEMWNNCKRESVVIVSRPAIKFGSSWIPDRIKKIKEDITRQRKSIDEQLSSIKTYEKERLKLIKLERKHSKLVNYITGRHLKSRKKIFYKEAGVNPIINVLSGGKFEL